MRATDPWIDVCTGSAMAWLSLYSGIAEDGIETYDLMPLLPTMMAHALQMLELPVGNQQSANAQRGWQAYTWMSGGRSSSDIARCLAQVLIYNWNKPAPAQSADGGVGRTAHSLLAQLLHTIGTFLHPSNSNGSWSHALAALLQELAEQYASRVGRERNGKAPYARRLYLTERDGELLVHTLLPPCLSAMFSKSPTLVGCAQAALRHLSFFHPGLVFPSVLPHVYQSLSDLNSPHRVMSMMRSLAMLGGSMLNRTIYPQGAEHIEQLLWLVLPGIDAIDPMKTALTLTWLTFFFYNTPLCDAREANTIATQKRVTGTHDGKAIDNTPHEPVKQFRSPSAGNLQDGSSDDTSAALLTGWQIEDQLPSADELDDAARSATLRYEEFSAAFLDAVFTQLQHIDKYAKHDHKDVATARLVWKVARSFFAALSPALYAKASDQLLQHVLAQARPHAAKQFGILCFCAGLANPARFVGKLLTAVYGKLVAGSGGEAGSEKLNAQLSTEEQQWYVYLLSQAVKPGCRRQ